MSPNCDIVTLPIQKLYHLLDHLGVATVWLCSRAYKPHIGFKVDGSSTAANTAFQYQHYTKQHFQECLVIMQGDLHHGKGPSLSYVSNGFWIFILMQRVHVYDKMHTLCMLPVDYM